MEAQRNTLQAQREHREEVGGKPGRSISEILAGARVRQAKARPDLEPDQIWITLADYMAPDEREAVLNGIELMSLAERAAVRSKKADAEQEEAEDLQEHFRVDKARGELVPLARFLKSATFREKLIAIAVDRLSDGDIEDSLGPRKSNLYAGEIGTDILDDWREEVSGAADEDRPIAIDERVLAAFVTGLSLAQW